MPRYLVKAQYYATFAYANKIEIEAVSAEEAGRIFEEEASKRRNSVINLLHPIDEPMDINGRYDVIEMPDGASAADVDDDDPEIEMEEFEGRV